MRRVIYPDGRFDDLSYKIKWESMKAIVCEDPTSLAEMVYIHSWPEDILGPKPNMTHVMFLDEEGATDWHRGYPLVVNPLATKIYHAQCMPGTTWPVRGTVYICPLDDYE